MWRVRTAREIHLRHNYIHTNVFRKLHHVTACIDTSDVGVRHLSIVLSRSVGIVTSRTMFGS